MNGDIPFDAITTFFVFLIGLPAFVFQWLAPEIRPIIVKRSRELLIDAGAPVVVALLLVGGGIRYAGAFEWMWAAILASLFGLAAFTAFRIPRKYVRRAAVVRRLEREIGRPIARDGRLVEDSLQDLLELGTQSQPGREKELVLQSMLNLTNAVCNAESYNGDKLADVAVGVLDVVLATPNGIATQNLVTASEMLKQLLRAFDAKADRPFMQTDLLHAIRALSRLGREAAKAGNESVALGVVQALETTGDRHLATSVATSQALFEIGVVSVDDQQILVAMSCAESLTALLENYGDGSNDVVADTLGLLAHFWESGTTGREYALQHLQRIQTFLSSDLADALQRAALHCAQTTQFQTADKVRRLAADRGETVVGS